MSGRLNRSMLLRTESPRNSARGPVSRGDMLPGVWPGEWMIRNPAMHGTTSPCSTVSCTGVSGNRLGSRGGLGPPPPPATRCAHYRYQVGGDSPSLPFLSSRRCRCRPGRARSRPCGPQSGARDCNCPYSSALPVMLMEFSAALPEWSKWNAKARKLWLWRLPLSNPRYHLIASA